MFKCCAAAKDGDAAKVQAVAAILLEPTKWNTEVLELVWVVRWTAKGLMPIRPVVISRGEVTLESNNAVRVHG